jgi:DNA-binding MarR family transcriptional regulator
MSGEVVWYDQVVVPALLRAARAAYGSAIQDALSEVGCTDVPRNGSFVLGSISQADAPLSEVIKWLGATKQAVGELVDTLVARGYLDRSTDPTDRRRLVLSLTGRGRTAAAAIRAAVGRVDDDLTGRVGPEYVAHTRATLATLVEAAYRQRLATPN